MRDRSPRIHVLSTTARTYLDHASTSPLRPEARAAMVDVLDSGVVGDPSRIHADGLAARVVVETARDQVAELLGARNREVCFTSSATEAIAAACWGAAERGGHQVVPAVEHSAVRLSAARLTAYGYASATLPVSHCRRVRSVRCRSPGGGEPANG